MITKKIRHFSIEQICDSGQCFRMTKLDDNKVEVIAKGKYLIITSNKDEVTFSCTKEEFEEVWKDYFDIDNSTDYEKIINSIDADDLYLRNAATYGDGIRILNQDLFEMIISFLISQQNNIKRIRGIIKKLCEKYGKYIKVRITKKLYTTIFLRLRHFSVLTLMISGHLEQATEMYT